MSATDAPATTLADYDLDGYEPGFPRWANHEARLIDARVASEGECLRCGHVGGEYRPYRARSGRGYRAFFVCGNCGEVEEF